MKKSALLPVALVLASFSFVSCGSAVNVTKPPSGLTERVFASQSASSPTAAAGLIIVNGYNDTVGRGEVSTGGSCLLYTSRCV